MKAKKKEEKGALALEVGKTYESEKGVNVVMEEFIQSDPNDLRFHTKEGYVFKPDGTPWIQGYATQNVCGPLVREVVKRRGK